MASFSVYDDIDWVAMREHKGNVAHFVLKGMRRYAGKLSQPNFDHQTAIVSILGEILGDIERHAAEREKAVV